MRIKEAIVARLAQADALVALVGSRVSPGRRRQRSALPAVTFSQASRDEPMVLAGGSAGLPEVRVQFDCWGSTDVEASQVADALRDFLNGNQRRLWGEVFVQSCRLEEGGRDDHYPPEHGDDTSVYVVTLDAIISYEEGGV